MPQTPLIVALPTADRRRSFAFYRDALGFDALGEPAEDGVPEPLQFVVNDGVRIMLVPTVGFGWITGGRDVAPHDSTECVLNLTTDSDADVDATVRSAHAAGGAVVSEPEHRPWGYTGAFADPDGHVWMVGTPAWT